MSDPAAMFRKLAESRKREKSPDPETTPAPQPEQQQQVPSSQPSGPEPQKRRGRPATGKRSDPDWLGRTYYIRKSTDLDVEEELLQLKRLGIELDKSELVDALLAAWVKWRNGEDSSILLGDISPRRNSE